MGGGSEYPSVPTFGVVGPLAVPSDTRRPRGPSRPETAAVATRVGEVPPQEVADHPRRHDGRGDEYRQKYLCRDEETPDENDEDSDADDATETLCVMLLSGETWRR
jgi:hypothetical protein